jgi:hypothetical protein
MISNAYVAMRGSYVALKSSIGGLVLNSDMSVSAFLKGGEIINIMFVVGGYRDLNTFLQDCRKGE